MPFPILSSILGPAPSARPSRDPPVGDKLDPTADRSSGSPSLHEPSMPSEQYMIFRRKRDSMEGPTIEGSSRERGMEGVAAAVADAVDAIGNLSGAELGRQDSPYSIDVPIPPPYIVDDPTPILAPPRFASVLPPAMVDFAAQYPLITIASLGSISTAVFIGSGALTARLYRRLSGWRPPVGLEGRLDDLERRLAQDILALRAQVVREEKGVVSRVPGRDASPQAVKNAPMSAANMGLPVAPLPKVSGKPHHADMSANAPIAPAMQEARLGQVVRQAVEDVMSARIVSKEVATTSGEVSTQNSNTANLDQVQDSLDRLESVTLGILDEIRLLREGKSSTPTSASSSEDGQGGGDTVLSMQELAKMIQLVRADSETSRGAVSQAVSVERELDASVSRSAPRDGADTAIDSREADPEEVAVDRAVHGYETGAKDDAAEVILGEIRKDIRRRKARKAQSPEVPLDSAASAFDHSRAEYLSDEGDRKATARGVPEPTTVSSDSAGEPASAASAPSSGTAKPISPSLAAAPVTEETGQTSTAPGNTATTIPASGARQPNEEPSKSETSGQPQLPEAKLRQPSPLPSMPRQERISPNRPSASEGERRLGIDDSGLWYFHCYERPANRGWHAVSIELKNRSHHVTNAFNSVIHVVGVRPLVRARIFFNPDAEMIAVDRGVWRCGREGALMVIRERISDYKV